MASLDEIMKKAPKYLTAKFNDQIAAEFVNYCEEEEMDTIELITDDLETIDGSAIVEHMADKFSWNDDDPEKEKCFNALRKLFIDGINEVKPSDLNWTSYNDTDCNDSRNYINHQCYNAFTAMDKSFMQIIAIGRNNNINIVPLLFDIYSKYRMKLRMSKINNKSFQLEGPKISHSDFCAKSKFLHSLSTKDARHKKIYNSLVQTLNSYQHRINPGYKVGGFIKIDDDINAFIEYTLNVSSFVKQLTETNKSCLPLLVDVWIVPKNVKEVMNLAIDSGDDGDVTDTDDEDDSDDEENEEKKENKDTLSMPETFELNLKHFKIKYEKGTIDNSAAAKCVRIIKEKFDKILSQNRRSVKICIIIDRRLKKDNLLIYQLPLKYSAIPKNYCNETLIYSSGNHFIYDLKRGKKNIDPTIDPVIGGKYPKEGNMFLLSFSLHEQYKSRIQFWNNGGGIRFWPQYMIDLWPTIFVNPKINAKYTKQYVNEKFKLKVEDELFDTWYKSIVDFDKL